MSSIETPGARLKVLLDAQQFNYFAASDSGPQPRGALEHLRDRVAASEIEVVGTLDLLQELVETYRQQPKKARGMVDLFCELSGRRILWPLEVRQREEAEGGGLIPESGRYLSRTDYREMVRLARRRQSVNEVSEEMHALKTQFHRNELEAQERVRARLLEEGQEPSVRLLRSWIADVDIDSWVADVVADGFVRRGQDVEVTDASRDRYPSVWVFVASRLARLYQTVGEGRAVKPSDLADAHHLASGPYVDVFVTDDKALRSVADLLGDRLQFRCASSQQFFEA